MHIKNIFIISILSLFLSSCFFKYEKHSEEYHSLKGWQNDGQLEAFYAFKESCKYVQFSNIDLKKYDISIDDWQEICQIALKKNFNRNLTARHFFEKHFTPVKVEGEGMFTGYYTIFLQGSKYKNKNYIYPIYSFPKNNQELLNFSRSQIENGALKNKNLEIFYTNDPVKLFFLHVQGSGFIVDDKNNKYLLSYSGRNNFNYSSIGKILLNQNIILPENMNAKTIKNYLYENPEVAQNIMNKNESYIFFDIKDNEDVRGAQGSKLTARRSLAVDTDFIPLGLPLWINTTLPEKKFKNQFSNIFHSVSSVFKFNKRGNDFNHLMIAQDVGSAIKGKVRGDIYFGFGEEAESYAELMQNAGTYYILLPKKI